MSESKSVGALFVARLARTILVALAVIGAALDSFGNEVFAPAIAFLGGALAFGGVAAITSAAIASGRLWFKTIAVIAVLGGAATLVSPTLAEWLAAQVAPVTEILKRALLTPVK